MSENPGFRDMGVTKRLDWDEHYQTPAGPSKIEARKAVYLCLEQGVEPVDFEAEAINALDHSKLDGLATIVDVGCSYPSFLQLWKLCGHRGRLIGIEPNTAQFNGLPFWQPLDKDPVLESLIKNRDIQKIQEYYRLNDGGKRDPELDGIDLYQATADLLPLEGDSADVVTSMFMFYHIPKEKQADSILEVRRILKPETGVFVLATSGNQNKGGMRKNETKIAQALTTLMGEEFVPPPPLSSGFTSEDALEVLPKYFPYVYAFEHNEKIVINDEFRVQILLNSYRSLRDTYLSERGEIPEEDVFERALASVLGEQVEAVLRDKARIEDKLSQALFMASDEAMDLPEKFKRVA